jgi:hypothetical protein
VLLENSTSYDTHAILSALDVIMLPHYFEEALTNEERFDVFGIFIIASSEM